LKHCGLPLCLNCLFEFHPLVVDPFFEARDVIGKTRLGLLADIL
jgi:hypothetical protein